MGSVEIEYYSGCPRRSLDLNLASSQRRSDTTIHTSAYSYMTPDCSFSFCRLFPYCQNNLPTQPEGNVSGVNDEASFRQVSRKRLERTKSAQERQVNQTMRQSLAKKVRTRSFRCFAPTSLSDEMYFPAVIHATVQLKMSRHARRYRVVQVFRRHRNYGTANKTLCFTTKCQKPHAPPGFSSSL